MARIRQIIKKYWYIIVVLIMCITFIRYVKSNEKLNIYKGEGSNYTLQEDMTETETEYEGYSYSSDKLTLTMEVPEGWNKTIKNGFDTFIHRESATSIQLQILDYYPQVNDVTAESLGTELQSLGYEITDFSKAAANIYLVSYQASKSSGVIDYMDYVVWDRSHVVKATVTVNDNYYEKLKDEIWGCINSINWEYESPIPDNLFLYYQLNGDFEYGIPLDWVYSDMGTSMYAYDESLGASLTVNILTDQTITMSEITKLDYADFAATGHSDYAMSSYEQGENYIYSNANFTSNGTLMVMTQYYAVSGSTHYILTFEYPAGISDDMSEISKSCIYCFRTFDTPADNKETEAESETDPFASLAQGLELGETEQSIDPSTDEMITETETDAPESDADNSEPVSTFADALMQVADIPSDKAVTISQIWDNLQAGTPTYAEAIKASDTKLILYITTDSGTAYYMTIGKDGTLYEIHVNAEDGPVIFTAE